MHVLPSGDLLGGCRGFEFFHMHFLPSGNLLNDRFFRMLDVSCGDELCLGEQRVDGLQVRGRIQRDVGRGDVQCVRCGDVQGCDGGRGLLDVSCGYELCIGEC